MNFVVCVVVLCGAVSMFRHRPLWLARTGAWAAVIPIFGPGYLLTIPFGIWALIVLHNKDVASRFVRE